MKKEKIAIIDANAIIHRAFHALPPLTTKDGVLVNAVYGFANILLKTLKEIKPDYIAVCFDVAKKTFRNEIYTEYKAQRVKGPDELYEQIGKVKELCRAFNMTIFAEAGYEADDLIGTLVKKAIKQESNQARKQSSKKAIKQLEAVIVTGDMDALQLVDDNVSVYTLKKGIAETMIYDIAAVKERYGFPPEAMVDYKALRGDPSDNIPGVTGIGEKTATDLIKEFGSLEKLYEFIDKMDKLDEETRNKKLEIRGVKKGVFEKLKGQKKQALMSQELAQIKTNVPIEFDWESLRLKPFDATTIAALFQEWNFKTLSARLPKIQENLGVGQGSLFGDSAGKIVGDKQDGNFEIRDGYKLIETENDWDEFLKGLSKQKEFAFDTETDGLNPFIDHLIGMSFSWEEGEGYYLPINRQENSKFKNQNAKLRNILFDEKIRKIGHNIKFDMEFLRGAGFEFKGIGFDTMVASYLLNPGSRQHKLDTVVFTEFGYEMTPIEELIGPKGKDQLTMAEVGLKRVADYACEDADYTWRLYGKLKKQLLKNDLLSLMDKIETPLIEVLAQIEENGVLVDVDFLNKMSKQLEKRIDELEKKIYQVAGVEFNVASPKQLKEILFDKLNVSTVGLGKTKTGISTAAAELEKLKGVHPIIDLIGEHRELSKLKSTYTDALPKLVNKKTGRIHTSFNQTVTATGRLSSSNPNLQNIPIRTELGRKIRQAFIAPKGRKLVAIDYSQIELRIVASLANDKKMLEAFKAGKDIHASTAAEVFGVSLNRVTPEMRRKAKEVNFGIMYGLGAKGLAQRTGVSYDEASAFIERYFAVYSDLHDYLEETIEVAREQEWVETWFGRKRYLPEINVSHPQLRSAAERMAVNHPIQGTAADLMKLAMIEAYKLIEKKYKKDEVKMILQVHDELVFEIKDSLVKRVSGEIKEIMEKVSKLKCPIVVEVEIGVNWGQNK